MNRALRKVLLQAGGVARFGPGAVPWRTLGTVSEGNNKGAQQHYDIIIVGGGMVGTALACSLGKNSRLQDKRVLLLEAASGFKQPSIEQYSNRVSAINKNAHRLMKRIGAWEEIERTRIKPVLKMQVWDACSDALITFNYDDFSDNISWIVENDVLLASVYRQLETVPNVEIRYSAKLADCTLVRDGAERSTVQLTNGELLTCELLCVQSL
uniref:FAD-binding domain-containing protein n=1 Tax=Anopheles albimanus TaxID=7167 RepID=A0A182FJL6_ANOAL